MKRKLIPGRGEIGDESFIQFFDVAKLAIIHKKI
jgi:hypothetical protein